MSDSAHKQAQARRDSELADVIAYLEQRRDNAATMAANSREFAEQARDRQRQLDVAIDELRAGLHCGAAALRRDMARAERAATGARIVAEVCRAFGLIPEELRAVPGRREVSHARFAAIRLLRTVPTPTGRMRSLREVGELVHLVDHSSVRHALGRADDLMTRDGGFAAALARAEAAVKASRA